MLTAVLKLDWPTALRGLLELVADVALHPDSFVTNMLPANANTTAAAALIQEAIDSGDYLAILPSLAVELGLPVAAIDVMAAVQAQNFTGASIALTQMALTAIGGIDGLIQAVLGDSELNSPELRTIVKAAASEISTGISACR